MSGLRILAIRNPMAGGSRKRLFDRVMAALAGEGADVAAVATAHAGHAAELAAGAAGQGYDIVVAAGGDGTINEVINGLKTGGLRDDGQPVKLAVLPMGTANVLANELHLPGSSVKLARMILAAQTRDIWLGEMDKDGGRGNQSRAFSLMVSAGFDAEVANQVRPRVKRILGKGAYLWETCKALFSYHSPGFELMIDGERHGAASVIVTKSHFYGGRFVCAPKASVFDRSLYVCLFQRSHPFDLLRYMLALALRRLDRLSDVSLIRAEQVSIASPCAASLQCDGDGLGGLRPLTISLSKTPLSVIVPV